MTIQRAFGAAGDRLRVATAERSRQSPFDTIKTTSLRQPSLAESSTSSFDNSMSPAGAKQSFG